MKKGINIEEYEEFLEAGFKECPKCGWAFDSNYFKDHECPPKDTGDKLPQPSLENDTKLN